MNCNLKHHHHCYPGQKSSDPPGREKLNKHTLLLIQIQQVHTQLKHKFYAVFLSFSAKHVFPNPLYEYIFISICTYDYNRNLKCKGNLLFFHSTKGTQQQIYCHFSTQFP